MKIVCIGGGPSGLYFALLMKQQNPAHEIVVGDVVRFTEPDLNLLDCGRCVINAGCGLVDPFKQAVLAFLAVLDRYTIADTAREKTWMRGIWARLPSKARGLRG